MDCVIPTKTNDHFHEWHDVRPFRVIVVVVMVWTLAPMMTCCDWMPPLWLTSLTFLFSVDYVIHVSFVVIVVNILGNILMFERRDEDIITIHQWSVVPLIPV